MTDDGAPGASGGSDSGAPDPAELTATLWQLVPHARFMNVRVTGCRPGSAELVVPLAGNENHLGGLYAGATFILAELAGGVLCAATFDVRRFHPIVTNVSIDYRRAITSDAVVAVSLEAAELARIVQQAEAEGRARFVLQADIKDGDGAVAAHTVADYQLRRHERG